MAYKNKEDRLIYAKAYRASHRQELRENNKIYRLNNLEKERTRGRLKAKNTPKVVSAARKRKWRQLHKGEHCAEVMRRYAAKLHRTPKWLSKEQQYKIKQFYVAAAKLTRETGIKHEVDHVMPLQGKILSGLHVPWNLQILTKSENARKNNKVL